MTLALLLYTKWVGMGAVAWEMDKQGFWPQCLYTVPMIVIYVVAFCRMLAGFIRWVNDVDAERKREREQQA